MEPWAQVLVGVGSLLTPIVLAAFARDRALMGMINSQTSQIHERINRTRDDFVRRDDLAEHLSRLDKQFDDMRADLRSLSAEIRASNGRKP